MEDSVAAEQARVHDNFPGLPKKDQDLIVSLAIAAKAITTCVNSDFASMSLTGRRLHEELIRFYEVLFMELKQALVERAVRIRLTPAQNSVLDNDFLDITFPYVD